MSVSTHLDTVPAALKRMRTAVNDLVGVLGAVRPPAGDQAPPALLGSVTAEVAAIRGLVQHSKAHEEETMKAVAKTHVEIRLACGQSKAAERIPLIIAPPRVLKKKEPNLLERLAGAYTDITDWGEQAVSDVSDVVEEGVFGVVVAVPVVVESLFEYGKGNLKGNPLDRVKENYRDWKKVKPLRWVTGLPARALTAGVGSAVDLAKTPEELVKRYESSSARTVPGKVTSTVVGTAGDHILNKGRSRLESIVLGKIKNKPEGQEGDRLRDKAVDKGYEYLSETELKKVQEKIDETLEGAVDGAENRSGAFVDGIFGVDGAWDPVKKGAHWEGVKGGAKGGFR